MKSPALVCVLALAGCDGIFDLVHVESPDGGVGLDVGPAGDASDAPMPGGDLVAWFPMDSLTPSGTTPELVASRDATCTACPNVTAVGKVGGALVFAGNGSGEILHVPPAADLETTNGVTVSAWLRLVADPAPGEYSCAVSKLRQGTNDNTWQICFDSNHVLTYFANSNMLTVTAPPLGVWFHVAIAWDGGTANHLYVEGADRASGSWSPVAYDGGEIVIGSDVDSGTVFATLHGAVDDLRVYQRALSDAEIQTLAAAQ